MCPHFLALQSREHLCNTLKATVPTFEPRHTPRRPCPRGATPTAARSETGPPSTTPGSRGLDDGSGGRHSARRLALGPDTDPGAQALQADQQLHSTPQTTGAGPADAAWAWVDRSSARGRAAPSEWRANPGAGASVGRAAQGPAVTGWTPSAPVDASPSRRQVTKRSTSEPSPAGHAGARSPPAATRKRRRRGPVVPFYSDGPSASPGRSPAQARGMAHATEHRGCDPPTDPRPAAPTAAAAPTAPQCQNPTLAASQDSFSFAATGHTPHRGDAPTFSPPSSQRSSRRSPRRAPCMCGGDECEDGPGRYYDATSSGACGPPTRGASPTTSLC